MDWEPSPAGVVPASVPAINVTSPACFLARRHDPSAVPATTNAPSMDWEPSPAVADPAAVPATPFAVPNVPPMYWHPRQLIQCPTHTGFRHQQAILGILPLMNPSTTTTLPLPDRPSMDWDPSPGVMDLGAVPMMPGSSGVSSSTNHPRPPQQELDSYGRSRSPHHRSQNASAPSDQQAPRSHHHRRSRDHIPGSAPSSPAPRQEDGSDADDVPSDIEPAPYKPGVRIVVRRAPGLMSQDPHEHTNREIALRETPGNHRSHQTRSHSRRRSEASRNYHGHPYNRDQRSSRRTFDVRHDTVEVTQLKTYAITRFGQPIQPTWMVSKVSHGPWQPSIEDFCPDLLVSLRSPWNKRLAQLFANRMPLEAVSGDETDHAGELEGFAIKSIPWRSSSPAVIKWFRTFDILHMSTRFTLNDRAGPGRFPRVRFDSHDRAEEHAKPVPGLPRNFYNPDFLFSLDKYDREALDIQPDFDLSFSARVNYIVARFKNVSSRRDEPLPPDHRHYADIVVNSDNYNLILHILCPPSPLATSSMPPFLRHGKVVGRHKHRKASKFYLCDCWDCYDSILLTGERGRYLGPSEFREHQARQRRVGVGTVWQASLSEDTFDPPCLRLRQCGVSPCDQTMMMTINCH
ncbi:hypothetical protein IMY05_C4942000100 [Salix suchowensis]|nr:hypothetical protein IMY05_C4942000100 [Salix suchowensis]